jgi:fructoselysine 6-kinase
VYRQQGFGVEKVVDTTGCGDAYQAAFMYNFLKGETIEHCMLEGTRLATNNLLKMGGN